MARKDFQKKCPKCGYVEHERIYRKWWMGFIPGTKRYSCNRCRSKFMIISWRSVQRFHRKELSMKERRQYKRFAAELLVKLEVITSSRFRVLHVKTKDISAAGAFVYTKEASFFPDDTLFILNSFFPNKSRIKLKKLKQLKNCTGTVVRSTSEGIAICFYRPVELFG